MIAATIGLYLTPYWEAIPPAILLILVSAFATLAIFALSYALAKRERVLDWTAVVLATVTLFPTGLITALSLLLVYSRGTSNLPDVKRDLFGMTFVFLVPFALVILIQWWLVRRRWRRLRHPTAC